MIYKFYNCCPASFVGAVAKASRERLVFAKPRESGRGTTRRIADEAVMSDQGAEADTLLTSPMGSELPFSNVVFSARLRFLRRSRKGISACYWIITVSYS